MIRKVKSGIKKLHQTVTMLSVEYFFVFITFFIALLLLIFLIRQIFWQNQILFDNNVFSFLTKHVSGTNTRIMKFFTFFGSHIFLIPAWLIFFLWCYFVRKNKWDLIKMIIITVSNLLLMFGLKYLFNRPRPLIPLLKEVSGLSFPSGHAFMSIIFFGMIMFVAYRDISNNWLKWFSMITLAVIIFIIGISRVYLRIHYASDVIAGFCFGFISSFVLLLILRKIEKSFKN